MERNKEMKSFDTRRLIGGAIAVIVIIVALWIRGFGSEPAVGERIQETRYFMDTVVTMQVLAENPEEKAEMAFSAMKDLSERANRFNPESEVYRINQNAGKGPVEIDEDIFAIIEKGKSLGEETGGLFTIAVAPLMDLWGFGGSMQPAVPDEDKIREILPLTALEGITLYPERNAVELASGMEIDLGGIAKGAVVDYGMEVLISLDVQAAFINAGGDIRVHGLKEDGTKWRIGIRDPRREDRGHLTDYVVEADTGSVVTSGDYERYFTDNGERYHHILDPRTGFPARGLKSVSVIGESCLTADVLSTAAFMMGNNALNFLENYPDYEGLIITEDGEILTTSKF